jgi:hypothetical protein
MVLPPKKNLQDVAVKQLSALSESLNSSTAIRFRREQKILSRRIPMIGIVPKVPSTTNTTIHKHHHHGAVCPSYGMGSMDLPDPMQVTSSEGLAKGADAGFNTNQ